MNNDSIGIQIGVISRHMSRRYGPTPFWHIQPFLKPVSTQDYVSPDFPGFRPHTRFHIRVSAIMMRLSQKAAEIDRTTVGELR